MPRQDFLVVKHSQELLYVGGADIWTLKKESPLHSGATTWQFVRILQDANALMSTMRHFSYYMR